MIRDERAVILDDILVLCEEAADQYEDGRNRIDRDEWLSGLFARLARERHEMAMEVEQHIRRFGDLPSEPDADDETVERLLSRLKSALTDDVRLALLDERINTEKELVFLIGRAMEQSLPAETRLMLRRLHQLALAAQHELATAKERV